MSFIRKSFEYITNKQFRIAVNLRKGLYDNLPDEDFLRIKFHSKVGYDLNLDNPVTFGEKIQWLKLYDHNPQYTMMVDKYAVKNYVAEKIGSDCIVPLLGCWESFNDINFDELPNQFVLKCTHDSGGLVICKDKNNFSYKDAKKKIERCMKRDYSVRTREWPYKNVPRRIIAEQFLSNRMESDLTDYKFYCFNGKPYFCQVITDRNIDEKVDFFDMNWNLQPFTGIMIPHKKHNPDVKKPSSFSEMIKCSEILSRDIPFVRIDFYDVDGKLYFGEMTFYPGSGFGDFEPSEWNTILGSYIDLSLVKSSENK